MLAVSFQAMLIILQRIKEVHCLNVTSTFKAKIVQLHPFLGKRVKLATFIVVEWTESENFFKLLGCFEYF